MKKHVASAVALLALGLLGVLAPAAAQATPPAGQVVLLHGLARGPGSMKRIAQELERTGFAVCSVGYPSRKHSIETLATDFVLPAIRTCFPESHEQIHFVTHSMGGILVRQLAASDPELNIGRVVMLSPPNGGSEIVDKLGSLGLFFAIGGPAGRELGTGASLPPHALGMPPFELGIIMGTRSNSLLLSMLIPGRDDGKVSIANARLDGMKDFLTLPSTHTFIMKNRRAIAQTLQFLRTGAFEHCVISTSCSTPVPPSS